MLKKLVTLLSILAFAKVAFASGGATSSVPVPAGAATEMHKPAGDMVKDSEHRKEMHYKHKEEEKHHKHEVRKKIKEKHEDIKKKKEGIIKDKKEIEKMKEEVKQ